MSAELLVALLFFGGIVLVFWGLGRILTGAVWTWETWGPLVLIGWIFFFPVMLVICFVMGIGREIDVPEAPTRSSTLRPQDGLKVWDERVALDIVIMYENAVQSENWSRYSFKVWSSHHAGIDLGTSWRQFTESAKDSFVSKLPYPEYVRADDQAIADSKTESEFGSQYKKVIQGRDGAYSLNPMWVDAQRAGQKKAREAQELERRRRDVKARLITSEKDMEG